MQRPNRASRRPARHFLPQQSIWWKWTAPFTGHASASLTTAAVSSAWLKVFTGDNLSVPHQYCLQQTSIRVECFECRGRHHSIKLPWISTDHSTLLALHWFSPSLPHLPPMTTSADALPLNGEMIEDYSDNSLATLEPGEPDYSAGWQINSIWWTWTASETGPVRLSAAGSSFWAFFHVFTGNSLDNLTLISIRAIPEMM